MLRRINKGERYFNGEEILIPHYTGDFSVVDCDRFVTEEGLEEIGYSERFIAEAKEEPYIEHEGVKYYPAEYEAYNIEESWELLREAPEPEL